MRIASILTVLSLLLVSSSAAADGTFGPSAKSAPSVFTYAYRGFTLGAVDGLAGGYLVARHDGFEGDDWKPLVYGLGIGAITGSALGFTLGFIDLADDRPGRGGIALRDMVYGAGFGALTGGIIGGLVVINSKDAEHIPFGAAIGALAGTGLGLAFGLIEGRRIVDSPAHRRSGQRTPRLQLSLTRTEDVAERGVWLSGLRGSF